jgi:hypothetical protein
MMRCPNSTFEVCLSPRIISVKAVLTLLVNLTQLYESAVLESDYSHLPLLCITLPLIEPATGNAPNMRTLRDQFRNKNGGPDTNHHCRFLCTNLWMSFCVSVSYKKELSLSGLKVSIIPTSTSHLIQGLDHGHESLKRCNLDTRKARLAQRPTAWNIVRE